MSTAPIGLYHPGTSVLHRLPAALKLLVLVAGAVVTACYHHILVVPVGLGVVLGLYLLARIPYRLMFSQLRPLLWMLVALAVFQGLVAGWRQAVLVVGVLVILVLSAALVTLTTRTSELVDTLARAATPLRRLGVDPERLALLLALGIRSVPVVIELSRQVREAQLARGLGNSPTAYAVPLVVRSLRHAESLGEALVARGVDD